MLEDKPSLYAWYNYGIGIETIVPIELIQSFPEAQWQQFCQIRVPQIAEQLRKRREQYQQVMAQIEQRQAQKQSSQES